MSEDEAVQAMKVGYDLATQAAAEGVTLIGFGEMGIANTTAASAICAALLPCEVEDITEDQWDAMMAVNCKGTFLFTKYVVPLMKANHYGKIVNFSSKSGKTGSAIMSHYCAAKAAVIGFTQALAYELAPEINVNCVCPGITENTRAWNTASSGYIENLNMSFDEVVKKFSEKVPLQRLAKIEEVTAVTTFLCSKGADYMTGQAINVTGGREMH